MTLIDLKPLQQVLAEFAPHGRTKLMPALHAAQDLYGYVSDNVAREIASALDVPLADVYGVIDFYTLFYKHPVGETIIHVCNDPACAMAGSESVMKTISQELIFHDTPGDMRPKVKIERAPCLGLCENAPALLIKGKPYHAKEVKSWEALVRGEGESPKTIVGGDINLLTQNCRNDAVTKLSAYISSGGYEALKKAVQMKPAKIIDEIKNSGLVGRGGAAFPTGIKWEGAANTESDLRFVVCNGDEAEPGTFKDRVLMENDPHRILEGMIICAYAIGSQKGYIYIRGEYLNAFQTIQQAVKESEKANLLGTNILGSDFSFEIELRRGAGAYICGEETALFESIEGKRGFPRVKPPFPTTHGLFGKPTVINNVETLANVPYIVNLGAENYRSIGTEKSPGPKLFCISGDVEKPGLYEVPFGVTLKHLIYDLAGGIRDQAEFQAALIGGAAGAFANQEDLDTRMTFEDLRKANLPLGSGVVTVFDQSRDLKDIMLRLAHFFADESCGKCYPCQIGTQRQHEIMQRIAKGNVDLEDQARLLDIITTMTDSSLCGLGQTAGLAIQSVIQKWPGYFMPDDKKLVS